MKKAETSEEVGQMKDKMRTYIRLAVAEKLGEFSQGYYQCNCFAVYLRLSGHKGIVGQAAKQILSEHVWDDCPDPRCPECSDALYSKMVKIKNMTKRRIYNRASELMERRKTENKKTNEQI